MRTANLFEMSATAEFGAPASMTSKSFATSFPVTAAINATSKTSPKLCSKSTPPRYLNKRVRTAQKLFSRGTTRDVWVAYSGESKLIIRPKNWEKFQHYKDRRPPWIRLYHSLLDDRAFWALKGDDSKFLVAIWLIASESEAGDLPSVEDLAFRLRLTKKKTADLLERLKEWIAYDASKPLAKVDQVATPETEAETEEI